MFTEEAYNILLNHGINISEEVMEYILKLPQENIQELNQFIIKAKKPGLKNLLKMRFLDIEKKIKTKQLNNLKEDNNILNKVIEEYKSPLNPIRHKQKDLFILDNFDSVSFRDDMASMEYPLFALKAGDTKDIYKEINGVKLEIKPTSVGRATIFDKDVWIYCISKMCQAGYEGIQIPRTVQFSTYDFLVTTNRGIGGTEYKNFRNSMERLTGTRLTTSISTGGKTIDRGFGLIDDWQIVKEDSTGKILHIEVTLPDWLYNSINSKSVLKIHEDYFRLRKPIDRRIYEIARKFCGNQKKWKIKLEILLEKTGSTSTKEKFRFNIISLVKTNQLPGYLLEYDRLEDMVTFFNRDSNAFETFEITKKNVLKYKKNKKKLEINLTSQEKENLKTTLKNLFYNIPISQRREEFLKKNDLEEYISEFGIQKTIKGLLSLKEKFTKRDFVEVNNPKKYFVRIIKNINNI